MKSFDRTAFGNFVKSMDEIDTAIEGLYVLHEGQPVYEYRWTPDKPRDIYSHTKSFIVTALGVALDEGLISLDDKLAEYFPESVPADADPKVYDIRLRDILTMSSGFGKMLLMRDDRRKGVGFPDYLKYMLSLPVIETPGTNFVYSSADTYLISRMVEKAVGQNMAVYMYERVLRPMDIPFPIIECCPLGHPFGGGGMFLKLSDQAKLGQLYLDGGVWNGKRIVSESWTKTCGSKQIDIVLPDFLVKQGIMQDGWHDAYGYQFWMCEPGTASFRADGAHGQITVIMPELGLVFAVQHGEHKNEQPMIDEMIKLVHGLYQ